MNPEKFPANIREGAVQDRCYSLFTLEQLFLLEMVSFFFPKYKMMHLYTGPYFEILDIDRYLCMKLEMISKETFQSW